MRKLGLYLGRLPGFDKSGFNKQELIECVRTADESGYDSFWLPEAWDREAFTILTELAFHTRRIHLCTGIINIFSRSPALIAMSAATLDETSGGRVRLGLGTSGARVIEDFHGVSFAKPLTRLRETVQIVRALFSGEAIDFSGECFELKRFKLGFKPLRSEIPIYVAALSPKSVQQVGEIADGWLPTHWPRSRLNQGIKSILMGAQAANRNPDKIEIAPYINVIVSDDITGARNSARLPLAYYIGGMGEYYRAALSRLGFSEEADRVRDLWLEGHTRDAIRAITDEMIDSIAICGNVESCRRGLDEVYEFGATLPLVPIPQDGSIADKCRTIEALATN